MGTVHLDTVRALFIVFSKIVKRVHFCYQFVYLGAPGSPGSTWISTSQGRNLGPRHSLLNFLRSRWHWLDFYMQVSFLFWPLLRVHRFHFSLDLSLFFWGRASPADGEALPWRSPILCKCGHWCLWVCSGSSLLMHRQSSSSGGQGERGGLPLSSSSQSLPPLPSPYYCVQEEF